MNTRILSYPKRNLRPSYARVTQDRYVEEKTLDVVHCSEKQTKKLSAGGFGM